MRSKALAALVAQLGEHATQRVSAVFTPSFDAECGVVLVQEGAAWTGWWVATLAPSRGDAVLHWIDPTTSQEPLATSPERLVAIADAIRSATFAEPVGPRLIVLDGCGFVLTVDRDGERATRRDNLAQPGAQDARRLAEMLCALAADTARWDATRGAFGTLRGYFE